MRLGTLALSLALAFGSIAYSIDMYGWTRDAAILTLILFIGWIMFIGGGVLAWDRFTRLTNRGEAE